MSPLDLHLSPGGPRPWHRIGPVAARGIAYGADGRLLVGDDLARPLADSPDADAFVARLGSLSGTFAAIWTDTPTVAAVDRIRSLPLFYGRAPSGTLVLSDDARYVAERTHAQIDDAAAVAEFMLQSASVGASTLSRSVRQVRAGEALAFGPDAPTVTRYFEYASDAVFDASEDDLVDRGVQLFEHAFERFLDSVRGRPVALPLSGGMDSRLIAAFLVRGGRTDAHCFTYGREGAFETRASRRIAEALGLSWTFVPYSNRAWHAWYASLAFQRFRRRATGLTAIEHEQDWPAVLTLRERGLPPDTVFAPGHAGDFLGGSHLPAAPTAAERDPVRWLFDRYYTEWPTADLPAELGVQLRDRISAEVSGDADPVRAFLRFGWQERQAKMIANSVRVYEDHGFDWRLPFWADADVLAFWGRVPTPLLRGRRLYLRVLRRLMGDTLYDLPSTLRRESPFVGKLRRLTDRDAGRYGIWLGPHAFRAALTRRVGHLVGDAVAAHTVAGPVVERLVRPIAGRPVPWAMINGLLALSDLDALCRNGLGRGR